jgi:DNA repair protein RadA/Sms
VEYSPPKAPGQRNSGLSKQSQANVPVLLGDQPVDGGRRLSMGMPEVERVLGGGVVLGSLVLMAGDPGIGKSTLLLQFAAGLAAEHKVLYVSGEESGGQVRLRAERLGIAGASVLFLTETSLEAILGQVEAVQPGVLIVDSIQTLYSDASPSTAGSVAQVRECTQLLMRWAKETGVPVFLAGHVTKDGNIAGPRVLEHMVDVVLYLEGESMSNFRLLHGVKNRFGATNDVALLEMRGDGLAEVADPSAALIAERQSDVPGSAVVVTLEGSRPLLAEVQALTNPSAFTPPRRSSNGTDFNRMAMTTAVLSRRASLSLGNQDIMVNVTGGLRINEPAADLAVALAIASSYHDVPLAPNTVFIGEVGLNGEVRRVPQIERRLSEAARHGFVRAVVPKGSADAATEFPPSMEVVAVSSLREAMAAALPQVRGSRATSLT